MDTGSSVPAGKGDAEGRAVPGRAQVGLAVRPRLPAQAHFQPNPFQKGGYTKSKARDAITPSERKKVKSKQFFKNVDLQI